MKGNLIDFFFYNFQAFSNLHIYTGGWLFQLSVKVISGRNYECNTRVVGYRVSNFDCYMVRPLQRFGDLNFTIVVKLLARVIRSIRFVLETLFPQKNYLRSANRYF